MTRTIAAGILALTLGATACGSQAGADSGGESIDQPGYGGFVDSETTEPTSATDKDTTESTAPADTTSTTEDPFAIYQPTEPFDITVEWSCDALFERGGGSFGSSCAIGRADHPILHQTNWNTGISYRTDENGEKIGLSITTNAYSPSCMWTNAEPGVIEVDLVDGRAVYTGLLIGEGRCEGIQWEFETVWDDTTQTQVTTGVIGPMP